jgi:uncharacterized membrane protein YoaT (DUF817 family)
MKILDIYLCIYIYIYIYTHTHTHTYSWMNHIKLEQRKRHIKVLNNLHAYATTARMPMSMSVKWEGILTHVTEISACKTVT